MTFTVTTLAYGDIPKRSANAFRFAVISDVHLHHRRTPTEYIINNLNNYITNARFMADIDCLFISGDLFDDVVSFASRDAEQINAPPHITTNISPLQLLSFSSCLSLKLTRPLNRRQTRRSLVPPVASVSSALEKTSTRMQPTYTSRRRTPSACRR